MAKIGHPSTASKDGPDGRSQRMGSELELDSLQTKESAMAVGADVGDVRKQMERLIWSAGNYPAVAQLIVEPALKLVAAAAIEPGMSVLDVGTGTGNVAIPAAGRGASVVGLDLTPKLLAKARARGVAAGVKIAWCEGDAEELPFADDSFDRVLSTFGVQFAPDQLQAARELVRVCRPGGLIGVCSWTPDGVPGRYIHLLQERLGGGHRGSCSTDWGDEQGVRGIFAGTNLELSVEHDNAISEFESVDDGLGFLEHNYGCAVTAQRMLDPRGEWQALRAEISDLLASANRATDGSLLLAEAYLRVMGHKPR